MPTKFKKKIDPPVTSSTYTKLIKECCVMLPDDKEYVGKCIAEFRKLALKKNEKKNFKFTVKSQSGQKLFCLKVTGGLKGLTRTKYYVNHGGIYRYDWRSKVWKVLKIIKVVFVSAATVGLQILGALSGVGNMLEYNPIPETEDFGNRLMLDYNEGYKGDLFNYGHNDHSDYDEESDSQSEYEDDAEDYSFNKDESEDEDEGYQIEKNKDLEYVHCKYWNDLRYCFIKFGCCDDWCCCRYCHMDSLNHRIGFESKNQVYCLRCSTVFWNRGGGNCPKCYYEHLYNLNLRNIADRCRFLMNASYIPKKDCCNNFICCYRCHNEEYDHMAGNNIAYFCCHCSNETDIDTNYCSGCGEYIKTDEFNLERIALKCFYLTKFYYLLSFDCCGNTYCCSKCHNGCEDHKANFSNEKVCIKCGSANETKLESFYCVGCNRALYSAISR